MKTTDNGKICALAFCGVANNFDGSFSPCCFSTYISENIKNGSKISDVLNSPGFVNLRKTMLENKENPQCVSCYQTEKSGISSLRQEANLEFANAIDESLSEMDTQFLIANPKIRYASFRTSNVCNFKCRTCNPTCSTTWGNETNTLKISEPLKDKMGDILSELKNIETLYFAGGEPFLQKEFFEIMNSILTEKNSVRKIVVNTNFSQKEFQGINIPELLNDLTLKGINLILCVSVDGTGGAGELIRKGFDWKNFAGLLTLYKTVAPKLELNFILTVSLLNVFIVPETIEKISSLLSFLNIKAEFFTINFVFDPEAFSILNLNDREKNDLKLQYEHFVKKWKNTALHSMCANLSSIIDFLNQPKLNNIAKNRKDFIEQNKNLDLIRNENSTQLFSYDKDLDYLKFVKN